MLPPKSNRPKILGTRNSSRALDGGCRLQHVVLGPHGVERARPSRVEPVPRLPLPAPVQQANRAGVQAAAEPPVVVPAESVLVPPVVDGGDAAREDEQEGRERAELVDAEALLQLHPLLDLGRVPCPPPPGQVQHHDARVEVAGPAARERRLRQRGRGPEPRGEVGREVGPAVLGRRHRRVFPVERGGREGGHVVGEDDVGVEVDDAAHAGGERG
ncbi:hypothetical protein PR202_gb11426 [Eleusine coracana subsp. coracana]|uniref:Uncharacterized protein n=1 Tax=Eleusine coracana subsp. coracana TaxID=191504 RepID=A0AAV5ELY3_ELECO|nr:hypothetical protein PR202_gb11426 [Eleusine coracana subsp. coracana]